MPRPFCRNSTGRGERDVASAVDAAARSNVLVVTSATSASSPGGTATEASTRTTRGRGPDTRRPRAWIAATWSGRPTRWTERPPSWSRAPRRLPTAPAPTTRIFTGVPSSAEPAHEVGKSRGTPEVASEEREDALVVAGLFLRLPHFEEEVFLLPPELPDLGHQPSLGRDEQLLFIGRGERPRHDRSRPSEPGSGTGGRARRRP